MLNQQHLMLRRDQVARIAGVSERKLDYWARTGLAAPTVDEALTRGRRTRLYDYRDAMSILVLANLRQSVSLQHLRQIVAHIRKLDFDVTEVRFALLSDRVHFQLPDGTWSGIDDPGQIILHEVLDLKPLQERVLRPVDRAIEDRGRHERRRGVMGSKAVVAGTRVPVATVQAFIEDGALDDEVLEAYPALTAADIAYVRTLATA